MGTMCSVSEEVDTQRVRKYFGGAFYVPDLTKTAFKEEYQEGNYFSEKVCIVRNKITMRNDVAYKLPKAAAPCTDGPKISAVLKQLQCLEHQNVAHFKEGFDHENSVILIYQKVEGKLLHQHVAQEGLSERRVAGISFSLVRALTAGASLEPPIVHGALAPKNIIVCSSGAVVLTDLGLVDLLKPDPVRNILKDSFAYMPPEAVEPWVLEQEKVDPTGAKFVDLDASKRTPKATAGDVWSLGVIMFELVSGRLPFQANRLLDLGRKIMDSHPDVDRLLQSGVSTPACKLIKSMLSKSPEKRPSLKKLLAHSWLVDTHASEVSAKPFDPGIYGHLMSLHSEGHFKKLAMRMIAENVPPSKIKDLQKAFNKADRNHDGVLSLAELRRFLKKHPKAGKLLDDLDKVWAELDGDGSGTLSIHEFVAATLDTQDVLVHDVLWKSFHAMDANHNGKLSRKELRRIVAELHGRLGREYVDEMMMQLEDEVDQELTFKDFCALMQTEGGRKPKGAWRCSAVRQCKPCQLKA